MDYALLHLFGAAHINANNRSGGVGAKKAHNNTCMGACAAAWNHYLVDNKIALKQLLLNLFSTGYIASCADGVRGPTGDDVWSFPLLS